MLNIKKTSSEGTCSKCASYQRHIAKLKKILIQADDESVRRCMQYEAKILEFKAKLDWLKPEDSSGSQSEKKVLRG